MSRQVVEVAQETQAVVGLDVVQSVREDLKEGVKRAPGLLREHLGEELIEETLDAEGLYLRVDQEPAVGLHHARTEGRGRLILDLVEKK